jgi:hypothetical protein
MICQYEVVSQAVSPDTSMDQKESAIPAVVPSQKRKDRAGRSRRTKSVNSSCLFRKLSLYSVGIEKGMIYVRYHKTRIQSNECLQSKIQ